MIPLPQYLLFALVLLVCSATPSLASHSVQVATHPPLPFSVDKPIIVLSLPHNADLAIARYFKCAGVVPQEMRRYWSNPSRATLPLGLCMQRNADKNVSITENKCGHNMVVLDELQYMEAARTKGKTTFGARCFDPVLYPGALEKLYEAVPNAFIVMVLQDEMDWYHSLSKDLKGHWKRWCNPTHNNSFPTSSHTTEQFLDFYWKYTDTVSTFIDEHPGWTNVFFPLEDDPADIGAQLQDQLGIPEKCWTHSFNQPLRKIGVTPEAGKQLHPQRRPDTIHYPILSVGLPLLGDAHKYFECGLGAWTVAHQWTLPSMDTVEHPIDTMPVGRCMQANWRNNVTNILKGCGHARVWSDIGYLRDNTNGGTCFYPSMEEGVLEQFAAYYPRATILNTVFESPAAWFRSVTRKNNLPKRWSKAKHCSGFPAVGAAQEDWEKFYQDHTQSIRDFAAKHTNLTFIEVPYSQEGGDMMQDIFQFPSHCWPEVDVQN